jgi:hypothetical protein
LPPAGKIRSPALLVALSLAGALVIPLLEKNPILARLVAAGWLALVRG